MINAYNLLQRAYELTVRPYLPRKIGVYSGVAMRKPRLLDIEDQGFVEHNQVHYLREYVHPGDDVGIIGGGRGITATVASRRAAPDGSVDIYEADQSMVKKCRQTLELNYAPEITTLKDRPVGELGETLQIMGFEPQSTGSEPVKPADLPEYDVLEIDCEGAEQVIIPNLLIRPRVIILEIHPMTGYSLTAAKSDLQGLGYSIVDRTEEDENVPVVLARKQIE